MKPTQQQWFAVAVFVSAMVFAMMLVLLPTSSSFGQGSGFNAARQFNTSSTGADAGLQENNKTLYHQLAWTVTGSPASCTVALDTAPDGVTWSAGGMIVGQTCTSNGSSAITSGNAAYVRINVTALSAGASIVVNYTGWSYNPNGGSGAVNNCTTVNGNAYYAAAGTAVSCDALIQDNGSGSLFLFNSTGPFVSGLNANNGELGVNASVAAGWSASGLKLTSTGVLIMTSGALSGSTDTGISRNAADVVAIGNGTANNTTAQVKAAAYTSAGTTFTSSGGCTEATLVGGATAGKFTTSGSTSCSTTITMGNSVTAPNGWSCTALDLTTIGDVTNPHQTASTQTTVTIATGTIVTNDVIQFSCTGY